MSFRFARTLLSAACFLLPVAATATGLIPVETFARHSQLSAPSLSPDGKYIALDMTDSNGYSHALVIYSVDDMSKAVAELRLPKFELAYGITWVSNTRLVLEKAKQYGSIGEPEGTGEIMATDFDGQHQDYLYGYQNNIFGKRAATRDADYGWGLIDGLPDPLNGHFYMSTRNWDNTGVSTLYDVDTIKNVRRLIGNINVDNMEFMVGADGKAHFAYGSNDNDDDVLYYLQDNRWVQMTYAQAGGSFGPIHFTHDQHGLYAYYAKAGGPAELVQQDENGSNRKVLASDGFSSVGDIQWTASLEPFATIPATGLPVVTYIDPNQPIAKLHEAISLKFPGNYVNFLNFSQDGGELLFEVSSDRDPGTYYLINTHTYKVSKLFQVAPWIDPSKMAERRSMHFKTSDGMEMEAILTIPNGVNLSNLPMVLFPHGGPIGVQDNWFYNTDAQFLASRGYLVLQVNYRGSSGRGVDFKNAGYHQWGTGIQQDLIDGVKWAIAQKYADPNRICVFGGSFGGYSALMAPIRAPGMFKCAVGYAGIYDMGMRYKKGDTQESKLGRNALRVQMGDDPAKLAANSPVNLADKINVPVLLIHGEDDQRAPFAQAKAMRAALEAAHKPYEWLVKPGEGHGFFSEADNVDMLNHLQAFLAKYIGPGAGKN